MNDREKRRISLVLDAADEVIHTTAHSFRVCRNGHVGGGFDATDCCKIGKLAAAVAELRKPPGPCPACHGTRRHICTFDCKEPCEVRGGMCFHCDGSGVEE